MLSKVRLTLVLFRCLAALSVPTAKYVAPLASDGSWNRRGEICKLLNCSILPFLENESGNKPLMQYLRMT